MNRYPYQSLTPILLALLFSLQAFPVHLIAQKIARPNNGERARPMLDRKYRKYFKDLRPWVQSGPTSDEMGIFLNRNMIVEGGAQQLPQNESSIAINPLNPDVIIASAVDARNGAHVYLSTDGGHTWVNKNFGRVNGDWMTGNDPSVAWDYLGNGYMMYGAFPPADTSGPTGESGVYVARTTDNGTTWTPHLIVIEHKGAMTPDSAFEDKYYVTVDNSAESPFRGRLYTPWKRVTDSDSATEIVTSYSTDLGNTWSVPIGVSPRKPGTSLDTTFGQSFPLITTGPDGTVYTVWHDGPIRSIGFARSTDGGVTWSDPSYPVTGNPTHGTARRVGEDVYHVLKGTFRAETYPTIMADNSDSSHRGWLYMAWAAGLNPDVYFTRSTDRGATWAPAKVIHSDSRNDQWWPWLAVDQTNGDIAVMYSDSRSDPDNILIDTWISYSSDGGDTWIDRSVTDARSDFRKNPYVDQIFAGDYSGNAFYNGRIYPSFLDTRNDNDVYTVVVSIRQPWPVDSLTVRSVAAVIERPVLTWVNPDMVSIYGKPYSDYSLVVRRDGSLRSVLPAGSTSFTDTINVPGASNYTYTVHVALVSDTSLARTVIYTPGDAERPAAPIVSRVSGVGLLAEFAITAPTLRGDGVSKLTNLAGMRIYRDGELVGDIPLAASDTGRVIMFTDTLSERGYYRYWMTVYDASMPARESKPGDTLLDYVGNLDPIHENFDGARPRFLYSGSWGLTDEIAISLPTSLTDSPDSLYRSRRNDAVQIFPTMIVGDQGAAITFSHIVIVEPSDSALLEISSDSGRTWQLLRRFTMADDSRWSDSSADAGDWRREYIRLDTLASGNVLVARFRLRTGSFGNLDGWYIDDIGVEPASVPDPRADRSRLVSVRPNPARSVAILEFETVSAASITVSLYDMLGQRVDRPLDGRLERGRHAITFDVSRLEPGSYYYVVDGGGNTLRGRIVVLK